MLHIRQFPLDPDQLRLGGKIDIAAQESGKVRNCPLRFPAVGFAELLDGSQRIVEKMRLDLCLQQSGFGPFFRSEAAWYCRCIF